MSTQLLNKPLREAVLELQWQLEDREGQDGVRDPAYPQFVGTLYGLLQAEYPFQKTLPAADMPDWLTPHIVKQQFRVEEDKWPLVQVGPGVATLNYGTNYDWESFSDSAVDFFDKLIRSYEQHGPKTPPVFIRISLRYLNAIAFETTENDVLDFLTTHLHTSITLPNEISTSPQIAAPPVSLDIRMTYPLERPTGVGRLRIGTGVFEDDEPAILWELTVQSSGDHVSLDATGFRGWLEQAHDVIERWFFSLIDGKLRAQFEPGGTMS